MRYDGYMEYGAFVREKMFENRFEGLLGMVGKAARGRVYIYDANVPDHKGELFMSSELLPIENGDLVDRRGRTYVEINNYKQHYRWLELKDNRGRIEKRWDGHLNADGTFDINEVLALSYQGIPGKIGLADAENMYLADYSGHALGLGLSASDLFNVFGNPVDHYEADAALLYDALGRFRYQVEDTSRINGTMAVGYKQEYKNGLGLLEERRFGHLAQDGSWIDEMTVYSFYLSARAKSALTDKPDTDIGKYGVADITVTTVYDEFGNESIYSLSNNETGIEDNGSVFYSTKFGFGILPEGLIINHPHLKDNLNSINFRYIKYVREEVKDNEKGRLIVIKDGFVEIDPDKGFGAGDPQYITFLEYPQEGDMRVSYQSFAYKYVSEMESPFFYAQPKWSARNIASLWRDIDNWEDSRWSVHTDNLRFIMAEDLEGTNFSVMVYDTKDERRAKRSISGRTMRLDGRLFVEYHTGKSFKADFSLVYFNRIEFPIETHEVDVSFVHKLRMLFPAEKLESEYFDRGLQNEVHKEHAKDHYIALIEKADANYRGGEYLVWDYDARGGIRMMS